MEETPGRASLEKLGCRTPPQLHAGGVGQQQQQQPPATEGDTSKVYPFSECEYNKGIAALENNTAADRDDILVEQLNHLCPKAHKWLLIMLNICFMENKIPTVWRQSTSIAILKPGKDSSIPKNYRPISLLCHTYTLYEKMILNRIAPAIKHHLIKEQAGFRSGKSCISQLLNLTQHIKNGYEEGMITGSKRHSLQAVELSQRTQAAVQIVSNLPAPSNGGPIYRFWACRSCGPAGWLALLLTKASDPGPTTLIKQLWICDICHKQIHVRKQISIRCNRIEHWVHLRCAGIRQAQYTDTWTCHLHRESRLTPYTDIIPPHRSQPWSKPPTHSPPTPPQPKHMSNTPPVPTGVVKPKPNTLIH